MFQRYRQVFTPIHATNIQLFADTGKFLKQKPLNTSLFYSIAKYLLVSLPHNVRGLPLSHHGTFLSAPYFLNEYHVLGISIVNKDIMRI
jgi:hypothetical protein